MDRLSINSQTTISKTVLLSGYQIILSLRWRMHCVFASCLEPCICLPPMFTGIHLIRKKNCIGTADFDIGKQVCWIPGPATNPGSAEISWSRGIYRSLMETHKHALMRGKKIRSRDSICEQMMNRYLKSGNPVYHAVIVDPLSEEVDME